MLKIMKLHTGHNPYFNRWFSAIGKKTIIKEDVNTVTILILIDGFLQCYIIRRFLNESTKSQSLF